MDEAPEEHSRPLTRVLAHLFALALLALREQPAEPAVGKEDGVAEGSAAPAARGLSDYELHAQHQDIPDQPDQPEERHPEPEHVREHVADSTSPTEAPAAEGEDKQISAISLAGRPSRKSSAVGSLRAAPSITTRPSGSMLSTVRATTAGPATGRGPGLGPRSRSVMSVAMLSRASRASIASRASRGGQIVDHYDLSPGLQQLIARLTNTKDVGLIAYLSAIPSQPPQGNRPPATVVRLQRKPSTRLKSIMKISKPTVRYEPTYRLDPVRPFRLDRAAALVRSALETGMADATYSEQWAADACRILAAYITQSIKSLEAPRYKITTAVSVFERCWQGLRSELRTLWDAERDFYCAASVETSTMIASAVVFAVYWE